MGPNRSRCLLFCGFLVVATRAAAQIFGFFSLQSSPLLLSDATMENYEEFGEINPAALFHSNYPTSGATNGPVPISPAMGNHNLASQPSGSAVFPSL
jgi:hypothetical protein